MMMDKYHCYVGEHFILVLISVTISHLISIGEDNLGVLC